ncbi:MAG: hypothetical protein H8D23_38720 [Candidatus Brocadiales bacterium]|nr:hypothetical protein [Candidatus Brocadiales bacterium]
MTKLRKTIKLKTDITLNELATDPSLVKALSSEEAVEMLVLLASIQPVLSTVACSGKVEHEPVGDRLLKVGEVAYRLNCSDDWVYRNTDKLPFTRRLSPDQLRFSQKGLEKYIKNLPS